MPMLKVTITLTPEQDAYLLELGRQTRRSRSFLIQQAVERQRLETPLFLTRELTKRAEKSAS